MPCAASVIYRPGPYLATLGPVGPALVGEQLECGTRHLLVKIFLVELADSLPAVLLPAAKFSDFAWIWPTLGRAAGPII